MERYVVNIPEDIVGTLEALDYEVKSREFIVKTLIESNDDLRENENFALYHAEYVDYFTQFHLSKKMIEDKYVPKKLLGHNVSWTLNYETKELEIIKNCDCKIMNEGM